MTGRKRRRVISLRLTEKELQHLNRLAAQSGLSREKLLRALIMGETIRPRPCTHHEDLLRKCPDFVIMQTNLLIRLILLEEQSKKGVEKR